MRPKGTHGYSKIEIAFADWLFHEQGFKKKEIAAVLGCTPNTATDMINRKKAYALVKRYVPLKNPQKRRMWEIQMGAMWRQRVRETGYAGRLPQSLMALEADTERPYMGAQL